MKKSGIFIIVLVLAAILAVNSYFTVAENEYACTVRFSKIIDTTSEPGLHFKIPFIDRIARRVSLKEQGIIDCFAHMFFLILLFSFFVFPSAFARICIYHIKLVPLFQDKNSPKIQPVPLFSTFSAVTIQPPGHIKKADKKEG